MLLFTDVVFDKAGMIRVLEVKIHITAIKHRYDTLCMFYVT